MDLRTERNLEAFVTLLGVRNAKIEPRIELIDGAYRTFIEMKEERVVLTSAIAVDSWQREKALLELAERWSVERTGGIPMRVFAASGHLCVSSTMPTESNADTWIRAYRTMRRQLETCLGDGQ